MEVEWTEYLAKLPEERNLAMRKLMDVARAHLPAGFEECMTYGMPGWVVPHSLYPEGYHVNPALPLPFLSIGSQRSHLAVYHMGIYAMPTLLEWFTGRYASEVPRKLDMGKSCIRFKKMEEIPYSLLGELFEKVSPEAWIQVVRETVQRDRNRKPSRK